MVNYNAWSENSSTDSNDDDAEVPSYTGAAYQPVEKPQPKTEEEQGVIFSRRVPLHELIDAADTTVEADDDDDDEADDTAPAYAYVPADVPRTGEVSAMPAIEPAPEHQASAEGSTEKTEALVDTEPAAEREPSAFEPVVVPSSEAPSRAVPVESVMNPGSRDYATHPMTYEEALATLDTSEDNDDDFTAARQPLRPFRTPTPTPPPAAPRPPIGVPAETLTYAPEDTAHLTRQASAAAMPPATTTGGNLPPPQLSEHLIFGDPNRAYNVAPALKVEEREPTPYERRTRGLVGLALAATGVEYFLRKADVRRATGNATKRVEEQRLVNERGQEFMRRQQQQFADEQVRQTETLQQLRTNQEQQPQEQLQRQEAMTSVPLTYANQQRQPIVSPAEQRPLPPIMMAPEAHPNTQETPRIMPPEAAPEEPKLHEMGDAWRHYMVDEHNREVATARTMGNAYRQERAQEIRQDLTGDDDTTSHGGGTGSAPTSSPGTPVGAGSGAGSFIPSGSYASGNDGGGTSVPSAPHFSQLPSGMTTPSLPQGVSTHVDPQHQLEAPKNEGIKSNLANPWFWLMLSLIIAAFFTAALI